MCVRERQAKTAKDKEHLLTREEEHILTAAFGTENYALAFIHSHCPSPPDRPAQRSAAAGSHHCHTYLHTWRLSCHPTHKHTNTHAVRERQSDRETDRGR